MSERDQIWFCNLGDGTRVGPITENELEALAKNGRLQRADQVWKKGWPDWSAADTVQSLNNALSLQPPPLAASQVKSSRLAPSVPTSIRFKRVIRFLGWLIILIIILGGFRFCMWLVSQQKLDSMKHADNANPLNDEPAVITSSNLIEIVQAKNKDLPKKINNLAELTRITAGPGMQVTYQIRILDPSVTKDMITQDTIYETRNDVIRDGCSLMKWGLDSGVIYIVSYNAEDGSNLFKFLVTKDSCSP